MAIEEVSCQVQLIKENNRLYHLQSIFFATSGAVTIWLSPFFSATPTEKFISSLYGIFASSITLLVNERLKGNLPFIEAIQKYEEKRFKNGLSAALYLSFKQEAIEVEARTYEKQLLDPITPDEPIETTTKEVFESSSGLGNLELNLASKTGLTLTQVQEVLEALTNGKSRSEIIKSILRMGGAKYAQGKAIMERFELAMNDST